MKNRINNHIAFINRVEHYDIAGYGTVEILTPIIPSSSGRDRHCPFVKDEDAEKTLNMILG